METPEDPAGWVLEQWRNLCAQAPSCMAVFDRELRYIAASQDWIASFEAGRAAFVGQCYYDLHPETPPRWKEVHREVLAGATRREDDEHFHLADGSEIWSRWVCSPWRRPDGSVGGLVVSVDNVTAEHLVRRRLERTEQELHLALDAAHAGTWEADLETFANKWSVETWRLYGLDPAETSASAESWGRTIVAADRDRVFSAAMAAMARREAIEIEWEVDLPGTDRWLLSRGRPVLERDGTMKRYIGVVIDVTERKHAEMRAAARAHELRNILDALPVGIARLDRQARYLYVNRTYAGYFACDPEAIVGRTVGEVIGREAVSYALPFINEALTGRIVNFENQVPFADGQRHGLRLTLVPDTAVSGEVQGLFVVTLDISGEQARETELERMRERVEQLTRRRVAQQTLMAVAHELRQPLHAATLFAEMARKAAQAPGRGADMAHAISRTVEEMQRANQILGQLFGAIREGSIGVAAERARLDLNQLVSSTVGAFRSRHPEQAACIAFEPCRHPLPVEVNQPAIEKVLLNLLRNASEAVGCGPGCAAGAHIVVRLGADDGHALLCVEDDGGGVAKAMRSELFEPFRTGKPNGLGLGLAISRQLIELEGGRIWHEDRPGGSAFSFSLPLTA